PPAKAPDTPAASSPPPSTECASPCGSSAATPERSAATADATNLRFPGQGIRVSSPDHHSMTDSQSPASSSKPKRVVLKLSGEALREDGSMENISPPIVEDIAQQIRQAFGT